MNHSSMAQLLATEYTKLSGVSGYLRSPLVLHSDGSMIGAYVVEAPGNKIRITDDAQILLNAMVNGVVPKLNRGRQYQAIAEQCGMELSSDGELFVVCEESSAPYFMARFLEAADRISYLTVAHRPKSTVKFEKTVGDALTAYFPQRLVGPATVSGASGHNLKFPFMLDGDSNTPTLIQPVSSTDGKLDWGNIYQAVGKFIDLKNNRVFNSHRVAVLEAGDERMTEQAKAALSETARVIVFRNPNQFAQTLRAA